MFRSLCISVSVNTASILRLLNATYIVKSVVVYKLEMEYYYYVTACMFFTPVFHWSLSYSKFPLLSRSLGSILADLKNNVVWMVFICLPNSTFSTPHSNVLQTISSAPFKFRITDTFTFHSCLSSVASTCLSSLSLIISPWSTWTAKPIYCKFFVNYH